MSVFISKQLTVPSLDKALSDYAVGESVFLNVNGTKTEFLVVNQGLPSADYDASCDGTWLLMKDIYTSQKFDTTNHDYANSNIHTYLNGTFLGLFDSNIKNAIKQVKIPYRKGSGSSTTITGGANGLAVNVFLLSYKELGLSGFSNTSAEGAVLGYFNGADNSKRIAYLNGTATQWWLRSVYTADSICTVGINALGEPKKIQVTFSYGVRPCIILPFSTKFDPDTNEVKV
jgi:hypothetical protein